MTNLMIVENGYATIFNGSREITTTQLHKGRYVRVDDGREYPQLCEGASRRGATLIYVSNADLARDCKAKLYKTRKAYEAAKERLWDSETNAMERAYFRELAPEECD